MDEIHSIRDEYGADFVTMLVDCVGCSGKSYYGINSDYAFSISNIEYITNLTFHHEIGHNFGLKHDRDNTTVEASTYNYAYQSCTA